MTACRGGLPADQMPPPEKAGLSLAGPPGGWREESPDIKGQGAG
jgi:hypothetical protein